MSTSREVSASLVQGVAVPRGKVRHLIAHNGIPDISSTQAALCGVKPPPRQEWWLYNVTNPPRVCAKCEALRP